jgi:hypothetical protein
MNNLRETPGYFLDDTNRITPHTILNADVYDDGVVVPRGGYQKVIPLTEPHSLWGGSAMFCISQNVLLLVDGVSAIPICNITGPKYSRMEYVELGSRVYMSNGYWKGVYELGDGIMREWGLPLPGYPELEQTQGVMPPGAYKLCFTRFYKTMLGGSGPISEVSWDGGIAGIKVKNRPADCAAWITQPGGSEFFLAPIDQDGNITSPHYNKPLPTFGVESPPLMKCICFSFGRLWGVQGRMVHFSEEFRAEHFYPDNKFPFSEDLVMLAPVNGGIFVASTANTWLLKGRDPAKMEVDRVGDGAIPGSATYTQVEGAGYEISKKLSQTPSPVWATKKGFVVGTNTGHLVHLTESRLRINPMTKAASLSRVVEGRPQTIVTLYGAPVGKHDASLTDDFTRGRIFVPAPVEMTLYGGVIFDGQGEYS